MPFLIKACKDMYQKAASNNIFKLTASNVKGYTNAQEPLEPLKDWQNISHNKISQILDSQVHNFISPIPNNIDEEF
jgi:hypothetical protein